MKIIATILLAFLAFCSCQENPEPPEQNQIYEWVTQTLSPIEFGFNDEVGGIGIKNGVLELWQASKMVNGSAWYSWTDSGEAIIGVRAKKNKSDANPRLIVSVDESKILSIEPADTSGYFSSQLFFMKPSFIYLLFESDGNFKSTIEVEWVKVTTKKPVKP